MSSAEMIQTHPSQTASLGGTESTHHQHGTVDNEKFDMVKDNASSDVPDQKATTAVEDIHEIPAEGAKFHKLSWIRLTSVLIVEAIALGSLSMPASFATLGMVPAILITVGIGFVAIYSSLHIGNTWLKFPDLVTYPLVSTVSYASSFSHAKTTASCAAFASAPRVSLTGRDSTRSSPRPCFRTRTGWWTRL